MYFLLKWSHIPTKKQKRRSPGSSETNLKMKMKTGKSTGLWECPDCKKILSRATKTKHAQVHQRRSRGRGGGRGRGRGRGRCRWYN